MIFWQNFSDQGIKNWATGPTRKAQIIVPRPKVPPRRKPIRTKEQSVRIRIMPKGFFVLSLITMATRSLGDVYKRQMHALSKKEFLNADKGDGVIDLGEILEKKELTYTDTTGLAYKIEDLKEWSAMEDWNRTTEDILICVKPDGSLEYMYYEDFEKKVQDKELSFLIDSGSYSDYDDNVEYAADVQALEPASSDFKTADEASTQGILACLENHDYYSGEYYGEERYYLDSNIGILNSGALGVVDPEGEMVYKNVLNEESSNQIAEAFAPVGADSILDVVNKEPAWAGKLDNAFMALNDTLGQVTDSRLSQKMLDNYYAEGKGNLSYILVKDPGKAKENIESNVAAKDYEKRSEERRVGKEC